MVMVDLRNQFRETRLASLFYDRSIQRRALYRLFDAQSARNMQAIEFSRRKIILPTLETWKKYTKHEIDKKLIEELRNSRISREVNLKLESILDVRKL